MKCQWDKDIHKENSINKGNMITNCLTMSFQYTQHLHLKKKNNDSCSIADKSDHFMSIQLFTSSVLMWLGTVLLGQKKTNRIWLHLKIEQIWFYSTLHKECLNVRACHCAWGAAAVDQDILPLSGHTHTRMQTSSSLWQLQDRCSKDRPSSLLQWLTKRFVLAFFF